MNKKDYQEIVRRIGIADKAATKAFGEEYWSVRDTIIEEKGIILRFKTMNQCPDYTSLFIPTDVFLIENEKLLWDSITALVRKQQEKEAAKRIQKEKNYEAEKEKRDRVEYDRLRLKYSNESDLT